MSGAAVPEPAVPTGEDPRHYARLLSAVYDATMAGNRAPARPRRLIQESWQRLRASGVDPDSKTPPQVVELDGLDMLRRSSGLLAVLDDVSQGLQSLIADGDNILIVADAQGRVLWRSGSSRVMRRADGLGFVEGAHWGENAVGTNAIGTALATHQAVQVFCAEHYMRSHHSWTCAAAPIRDPRTRQVIGVVDVSGPAATIHPTTVALVDLVTRLAESRLREQHNEALNQLRAVAAPILARIRRPAMAVDDKGWVAAIESLPVHNRILLPPDVAPGRAWVAPLGGCYVESLPGGWLIRMFEDAETAETISTVTLDLRKPGARTLEVTGPSGCWRHDLSLRHAEILYVLATFRRGRSAAELAGDLYGDPSRVVTVRAEMSRLRRRLRGVVLAQPYRFCESADVEVLCPGDTARSLPSSVAPAIQATHRD
jgi:hypothetical protein